MMVWRRSESCDYYAGHSRRFLAWLDTRADVDTVRDRSESNRRPFTLAELRALLAVAGSEWRSLILFGLYTGQRLGDVATLTWQNLDITRDELPLTTRKTGRRQIPPARPDHPARLR